MYELYVKIREVKAASKNPKLSREAQWSLKLLVDKLEALYKRELFKNTLEKELSKYANN